MKMNVKKINKKFEILMQLKPVKFVCSCWPGLAFADPALHLGLLIVVLVMGVVSPPGSGCYHGPRLARGVIGGAFYKMAHAHEGFSGLHVGYSTNTHNQRRIKRELCPHLSLDEWTELMWWAWVTWQVLARWSHGLKTGVGDETHHPESTPWSRSSSWTGWTWGDWQWRGCRRRSRCSSGPAPTRLHAGR